MRQGAPAAALLPELGALGDVLARQAEWADDLRAIRARELRILQLVAARYQGAGETASAVVLLEAAVRELEEMLGLRHPGILALSKRAEAMFEALPPDVRQQARCRTLLRCMNDCVEACVARAACV